MSSTARSASGGTQVTVVICGWITDQVNDFGTHFVPRFIAVRGQADCWHAMSFLWKAGVVAIASITNRKLSQHGYKCRLVQTDVCRQH